MKKIAILLTVLMILTAFTGCGSGGGYIPTGNGLSDEEYVVPETVGEQEESEEFYLAFDTDEGFNPYQATALNNQMVFSLIYQGLFSVDRNYNVEGILCKSYLVTQDLCTHTFLLEEAAFSDGSILTAEDVVASLEAAKASQVYGSRFNLVESITAVDAQTVRIVTDFPYENLPMLLDIPITKAGQVDAEIPSGTGPYVLNKQGGGYVLNLRSAWWCDAELAVDQKQITLRGYENATEIRDAFQFGQIGISLADPGASDYAQYRCDYELWDMETGVFVYLVCNSASTVFSNEQVRSALTYAIDRATIVSECYNGFGTATVLAASPASPFYNKALANTVSYDMNRLQQAVIDGGLAESQVTLLVNKNDLARVKAAKKIAQMLEECGLLVQIEACYGSEVETILQTGVYDLYLGQTRLSAATDLTQFFAASGSLRYGGLANSNIYDMGLKALENSGNFYNLHQMILEDGQLIPIAFRTYAVYAQRGLVSNLDPVRDNVFGYSLGKPLENIISTDYGEED